MSIAVGRMGSPTEFSGGCRPAYEERRSSSSSSPSSSSSSSIGVNSEGSPVIEGGQGSSEEGGEEVQSKCKESLDSMDSLEESLPIRGISSFYNGKSKSFTSLMDAMCSSSAKDLGKPENIFTRKRKNILAYKNLRERPNNNHSQSTGNSICKRHSNSIHSTLPPPVSISSTDCKCTSSVEEHNKVRDLPPLPPSGKPKGTGAQQSSRFQPRSFSLTDLHSMVDLQQPLNCSGSEKQRRLC